MQVLEDVGDVVSEVGVSVGEQTGRIVDILELIVEFAWYIIEDAIAKVPSGYDKCMNEDL